MVPKAKSSTNLVNLCVHFSTNKRVNTRDSTHLPPLPLRDHPHSHSLALSKSAWALLCWQRSPGQKININTFGFGPDPQKNKCTPGLLILIFLHTLSLLPGCGRGVEKINGTKGNTSPEDTPWGDLTNDEKRPIDFHHALPSPRRHRVTARRTPDPLSLAPDVRSPTGCSGSVGPTSLRSPTRPTSICRRPTQWF